MHSKRLLKRLLTSGALLCVALILSSCDSSSQDLSKDFPSKTGTRIELLPDSAGEEIRYIYTDENGGKTTKIEYRNGVTSYLFHRPDGTAKEIKEFYPAQEGETGRQVKSQISLDSTGKNYLSHAAYRADGSLERQGERIADDQYRTKWYFEDGTTIQNVRLFDSQRKIVSADGYYKNGSPASQSRRINAGELLTKFFSEDGKLTHEFTEGRWNVLSGSFYGTDGLMRARFNDPGYKLNSQYFEKGELKLEVEYLEDSMEVTSYGSDGKLLFKQVWTRMGEKGEECTADYRLFKVEGFWQLSSDQVTYNRQTIEMTADGTSAQSVETEVTKFSLRERTVKMLRPDGSVSFVKNYREDILISERPGRKADRVDIKALLTKPAFECLPIPSKADRYKAHSSFI